ncbi:MAG TPA: DUF5995 family protein, partial [Chitinophagaceae bacterium]
INGQRESNVKKLILAFGLLYLACCSFAQKTERVMDLLLTMDSIANSSSVSKYFAGIYLETTVEAVDYFSQKNTRAQELIERLEVRFAHYFFRSAIAYQNKLPVHEEWKAYYADSTATPLRYILYGINAHINGDIWQALVAEFSAGEIEELKPYYFLYRKELLKNYKNYYADALASNPKMRTIHAASFGFDKLYGKILLGRWRKRQMELAELYFTNRSLFEKKKEKLHRRMNRLNELIRKNI